jgi:two-component system, NtrC family, sensor kinase
MAMAEGSTTETDQAGEDESEYRSDRIVQLSNNPIIPLAQSTDASFIGTMAVQVAAHELRNTLAVISTNTELLLSQTLAPELQAECARRILASTKRAELILENSLRSIPLVYGEMTGVDLISVLEASANLLLDQMNSQNVTLIKDLQAVLPIVPGNAMALQHVFINLITNALKAMPRGGELTISAESDQEYVEISFRDTGCGVKRKSLARVFDPFFTADPTGAGAGLGLSICRNVIKQHGGTIAVESKEGKGSAFTIRLPH